MEKVKTRTSTQNLQMDSESRPVKPIDRPCLLGNDAAKPWVVQKFGGTSVGKAPDVIAGQIIRQSLETYRVIAVFSASSSATKNAGTTAKLLRAAKEAVNQQTEAYHETVDEIRTDHITQSDAYIATTEIRNIVHAQINKECSKLTGLLGVIEEVGEVGAEDLDVIISKGELLACYLMSSILEDQNVLVSCVDLSEIIVGDTGDSDLYRKATDAFVERVYACGDRIPVLKGYLGKVQGGILGRIGRGFTDLCAALVAVGIHAQELQIWKEVDGIFTASPSKVAAARLLPSISPAEVAELTFYGSEVIHPFTMHQAIEANVKIRIRNVMNLNSLGTVILPETDLHGRELVLSKTSSNETYVSQPTAIAVKNNILILNVHSSKSTQSHFFARIFAILNRWQLPIDLISTSEVHVSVALHSPPALLNSGGEKEALNASLTGAIDELAQHGTVTVKRGLAIIGLVGKGMIKMKGIAGKMFSVLGEHDVNIEMISQGANEINISCVIEECDADRAANVLHTHIFTYAE